MNHRANDDKPTFALLGGQRITGIHIARMFRALTGRLPTVDQVAAAQRDLDAAYEALEGKMEEPKNEKKKKADKVDYGKLTADALNAHTSSPEFNAKWKAYLEWLPDDLLTPERKRELEELRAEEAEAKKP
jgi:hypothetical protein